MEFIDRTGHIFSLQSYNDNIGWEYKDNDYIFWFDDVYTGGKLSINSYYIQQITPYINNINKLGKNNSKIELDKLKQIKISCKSDVFKLIPYNIINKSINNINNNSGAIDIDIIYGKTDNKTDNDVTTNLSEIIYNKDEFIIDYNNTDDINTINDIIFPFFVICTYNKPETVMTNILIEFIYNETLEKESADENGDLIIVKDDVERSVYCPVRTGGLFVDEAEQLYINMTNMGIELPKSILDGIYQHGLTETGDMDYDIALYNEKIKEYLLHYNSIRGEIGNYKSVLSSLKWFGWGDKLKLTKLLKTDNELLDQFIRDSFDSDEDIVSAFMNFRNSAYISVSFKDNDIIYNKINKNNSNNIDNNADNNHIIESIVYNEQDWSGTSDMVGEGTPKLADLFNRWDKIHFDGCEDIDYYQPFYIYNKNIILLKLAFFKYYYKKYFLPVHLSTKTVSMEHICFIPDIKLYNISFEHYNSKPVLDADSDCEVYICNEPCLTSYYDINNKNINKIHTLYINTNKHYIDSDFCEFEYYNKYNIENNIENNNIDIYESHELSFNIPITFKCTNNNINKEDYIFNTNIIITKSNHVIYECNKIFRQTDDTETSSGHFKSIVIIPKLNEQLKRYNIDWSCDNNTDPYIIDVRCNGKWFRSFINIKEPKPEIHTYYLKYLYDNRFSQLRYIDNQNNKPVFNAFMYHPELITVNDINYTDKLLMDNINRFDLVNNYKEQYNIPSYTNKPEYYNLILYYDINITNDNYNTDNIYNDLFVLNKETNKYEFFKDDNNNINNILYNIDNENNILFDAYIMKTIDNKYYLVFISIDTIDNFDYNNFISNLNKNNINIYKKTNNKDSDDNVEYTDDDIIGNVKYSSNKISFLINRMQLVEPEVPNNFDSNSKYNIICCSLYNIYNKLNESIAFSMSCTSKWEISTFSLYNKRQKTMKSNSAFGIISLQDTESDYLKGIYQIKCNWSFDGTRTKSIISPYRIRIN